VVKTLRSSTLKPLKDASPGGTCLVPVPKTRKIPRTKVPEEPAIKRSPKSRKKKFVWGKEGFKSLSLFRIAESTVSK